MSRTKSSLSQGKKINYHKLWPKGAVFTFLYNRYYAPEPDLPIYLSYPWISQYSNPIRFRLIIVRSAQYAYMTQSSIEAFRKVISPYFRRKNLGFLNPNRKFGILIYSFFALTKKPGEVRMGGGKGRKLRGYFSVVKPGQALFYVSAVNPSFIVNRFKYASRKLGIRFSVSCI